MKSRNSLEGSGSSHGSIHDSDSSRLRQQRKLFHGWQQSSKRNLYQRNPQTAVTQAPSNRFLRPRTTPPSTTNFDAYYSYQGSVKPWGEDAASSTHERKVQHHGQLFLPGSRCGFQTEPDLLRRPAGCYHPLDHGANWQKLISLGKLVDINTLRSEAAPLVRTILRSSQAAVDNGDLYGIPDWARKGATGGNAGWMVNRRL